MRIGIIGFGSFGRLAAKHLREKADVFVADISNKREEAEALGVKFVSLEKAARMPVVILAVPMENFREVLLSIREKVVPGSLVLDVCSLKMFACKEMQEILPENVEIIGTHPLFGPNSAPNSLVGMRIALCPVRSAHLGAVKSFCESLGLEVFVTTPEEHDRQMAASQALTHFIGQIAKRIGLERVQLSTKTFEDLMSIIDIVKNDSGALFRNMQQMNPFAQAVRKNFIDTSLAVDSELKGLIELCEIN